MSNEYLDRSSTLLVVQAFAFVVKKEHGIEVRTGVVSHDSDFPHAGVSQWLFWLNNQQLDRLTSNDHIDAGGIYPTNLTMPRLVDALNGGNDRKLERRFWAAYNTFTKAGDPIALAIQKATIAACPRLPLDDESYQMVWRYKKFAKAVALKGRSVLTTVKGVSI